MKRNIVLAFFGVIALMAIFSGSVMAKPNTDKVQVTNNHSGKTFSIPAHAVEMADGVFSLGTAIHNGQEVEGLMYVYKESPAKPDGTPGGGNGGGGKDKGGTSSCYTHLAKGAKWKANENWVVNGANTRGLLETFVFDNVNSDIQKWEDSAAVDMFGTGTLTTDALAADTDTPDDVNEVYFAAIDNPGVIAVTITWGIFGGPPHGRELVEWDQIYDDSDFDWSATGEAGKMDFENIATHELGHAMGMGHPDSTCTEETMYAYAANGETKKRDLNAGDEAGIQNLNR